MTGSVPHQSALGGVMSGTDVPSTPRSPAATTGPTCPDPDADLRVLLNERWARRPSWTMRALVRLLGGRYRACRVLGHDIIQERMADVGGAEAEPGHIGHGRFGFCARCVRWCLIDWHNDIGRP